MKSHRFLAIGLAVLAFVFVQGAIGQTARGPLRPEGVAIGDANAPQPVKVMIGQKGLPPLYVAPPANFAAQPKSATFTIQYLNAGEVNYFGDVCVGWPAEAKEAFTYAANIWGTLLNSTVPIVISACWANMGTGGILGHGGARSYYRDFTGAPQASTFYPVAIANALYGSDLNSGTEEIVIAYNNQFTDWYFGTGTCPSDKIDFVQVIMHEMCHGLGFIGSMSVSGGLGSWGIADGSSAYPVVYDRYTEDGSGIKLIAYASGSVALYNQLVSGSVYFNGANANAGNGGAKVKLYAPSTWSSGSSYAHLDEIFKGTVNGMMTYSADYGSTIHDPGPVTKGILKDNGWTGATPSSAGPAINANGTTGTLMVNYPAPVSINVAMNAGAYAGANVDWWVIALTESSLCYYDNTFQWALANGGDFNNVRPMYQGALIDLPSTSVLNCSLAPGAYTFWFAISYPMSGVLSSDKAILYDKVVVNVQ